VILPLLTAIVDAEVAAEHGWTVPEAARACLAGGARLLQIRGKRAPGRALLAWCDEVVDAATPFAASVVVNDRAEIARMAGAAGVHVGQDDLPPVRARGILGDRAIVGLSTHTIEQIAAARESPIMYLAVGPVFGTATKDTGYEPVGTDLIRHAAQLFQRTVPIVAIGGITLERAPAVLAAGAASVAVIRDLFATGDPEARTRQYLDALATNPANRTV
jgi:thiamine-phosphate pyrophosphorylase